MPAKAHRESSAPSRRFGLTTDRDPDDPVADVSATFMFID
jgi:hypothetical protein